MNPPNTIIQLLPVPFAAIAFFVICVSTVLLFVAFLCFKKLLSLRRKSSADIPIIEIIFLPAVGLLVVTEIGVTIYLLYRHWN